MSDENVSGDEAGQGEVTGGSSPREERMVPLSALLAERDEKRSFRSEVESLRKEVESLKQSPKTYSRAELESLVDDGKLSRTEADRILEDQTRKSIKAEVTKDIASEFRQQELGKVIKAEIKKYIDFHPDIITDGSDNRRRVAEEYARQLDLGKPDNMQTELDALTAVFGPSNRLQKGKEKQLETHQDVGSDGGGGSQKEAEAPKLPAHVKAHYSKMIEKGMYKGWDDPNLKKEVGDYGRW